MHNVTPRTHTTQKYDDLQFQDLLRMACGIATAFLQSLKDRPVGRPADYSELVAKMGGSLPAQGEDPLRIIQHLSTAADPGLIATAGPRYFGFVTGGALPAAVATEWLAAAWDQNAFTYILSPAAAAVEEIVRQWLIALFGLSDEMSLGFVTGGTMANFTALASARHALLQKAGWNVEEHGLLGAPAISVIVSDESHVSIFAALQMLGLGRERVTKIPTDKQGRMQPKYLKDVLDRVTTPVLVCAQAGNVNTGSFDPVWEIEPLVHERQGWLHVDGAFGMWAAASPTLRALINGVELADSISVDCHKWLNVPYDSGLVFVRSRQAHQAAMTLSAPYYASGSKAGRENHNWVPEASRRARGFAIYAALRSLGCEGVAELVDRCCYLARRMAMLLARHHRVQILNEVILNQVLIRFLPPTGGDADAYTSRVIRRIQEDGTCWVGGTIWQSLQAMRLSVSNWSTTEADIDISAEAIIRCMEAAED